MFSTHVDSQDIMCETSCIKQENVDSREAQQLDRDKQIGYFSILKRII